MRYDTVIVADGSFPVHETPLGYLRNAEHLICCDGAADILVKYGFIPEAIVGDLDSLGKDLAGKFPDRIYQDTDQETNDLTKAVNWCAKRGYNNIAIIGATGKREDHTIGNISLLTEYSGMVNVIMVTDTGVFIPYMKNCIVRGKAGQQVSIFSIDPTVEITTVGLKYELCGLKLHNWWRATLNEMTGDSFKLHFSGGQVIVYMKFF